MNRCVLHKLKEIAAIDGHSLLNKWCRTSQTGWVEHWPDVNLGDREGWLVTLLDKKLESSVNGGFISPTCWWIEVRLLDLIYTVYSLLLVTRYHGFIRLKQIRWWHDIICYFDTFSTYGRRGSFYPSHFCWVNTGMPVTGVRVGGGFSRLLMMCTNCWEVHVQRVGIPHIILLWYMYLFVAGGIFFIGNDNNASRWMI